LSIPLDAFAKIVTRNPPWRNGPSPAPVAEAKISESKAAANFAWNQLPSPIESENKSWN